MYDQLTRPSLEGHEIDDCHLLRRLNAGGMGDVYLAQQHRLGDRLVAIKVIPLDETTLGTHHEPIPSIEQRFIREGKLLGHLTHPHILPVHDAGADGNLLYLIMQYAPDGSLMDALRGRGPQPLALPLPLPFALDLLGQVASALHFIHQHGIVHRDVKPSNILVHVESEDHWHVMLADFGIARAADSTAQQHLLAGTLAYMAPEQFRGYYSPASDQYSLAVVAYLLFTGRLPYEGGTGAQVRGHLNEAPTPLGTINPAIPTAVEQAVLRALAKQPKARYASVAAFMTALWTGARNGQTNGQMITEPGGAALSPRLRGQPSQRDETGVASPPPFAVAPARPPSHMADAMLPLVVAPQDQAPRGGASTTEPNPRAAYLATTTAPSPPREGTARKSLTAPKRRAAVLLTCLVLLLIAIAADLAIHHIGQTVNGANQPPFKSASGATAVAATATATTGAVSSGSGSGPSASPTAAAVATSGGPPATPNAPPAATADAPATSSQPSNAAEIVSQPAPAQTRPGQRYTVAATFVNTGTSTWQDGAGYGLRCDRTHHPQSACATGAIISFSHYLVSPGQQVTFAITLVAPTSPGVYESWWALEQHGVAFGRQDLRVRVTVSPPAPAATPTPTPAAPTLPTPSPTPSAPIAPPDSNTSPHTS